MCLAQGPQRSDAGEVHIFTLMEKLSLCEYLTNILRTALFTVIVRYIFTSCREYPANKSGLTKK